jgi:hypothetical protein
MDKRITSARIWQVIYNAMSPGLPGLSVRQSVVQWKSGAFERIVIERENSSSSVRLAVKNLDD